jgi:hypothetical protein
MPVWETSQKPYDAKSAVFTMSKKFVTLIRLRFYDVKKVRNIWGRAGA